jgi:hypothetical protein
VRVRDGVANLTVSGPASEAAVERSSDLRAALAGQGLRLGRIDRASAGPAGTSADVAGSSGPRSKARGNRAADANGTSPLAAEEPAEESAAPADLASGLQ